MYDECSKLTGFANEEIRKLACSGMMHVALGISKIRNDNSKLAESIKKGLDMILNDQDNRIVSIFIGDIIYDDRLFKYRVLFCPIIFRNSRSAKTGS